MESRLHQLRLPAARARAERGRPLGTDTAERAAEHRGSPVHGERRLHAVEDWWRGVEPWIPLTRARQLARSLTARGERSGGQNALVRLPRSANQRPDALLIDAPPHAIADACRTPDADEVGADRREACHIFGAERAGQGREEAARAARRDEGCERLVVEPVEQAPPVLHRGVEQAPPSPDGRRQLWQLARVWCPRTREIGKPGHHELEPAPLGRPLTSFF